MVAQLHSGETVLTANQTKGIDPLPVIPATSGGAGVNVTIKVYGGNARETAKQIMYHLKSVSPKLSPAS